MSEDLIANNFVDNVNRTVVRRNIMLTKVGLWVSVIYFAILCIDWYYYLLKPYTLEALTPFQYYVIFVYPVVLLILMFLNIYGIFLNIKANKNILLSFENSDSEIFNEGYHNFTKASIVSIVSFSISALFNLSRFFFK